MKLLNQRNRSLLREFVATDFKLRYQGSVLGYLWSLVKPLALFTILYVVFAHFFKFGRGIPNYPTYLLLGVVLWTFFIEATTAGMTSIVNRGDLIRKVSLPKYLIVLSTSFSALINLGINLLIVAGFMLATGVEFRSEILFFPLVIAELLVVAVAASFLLAALFVRYRDIAYIWELALQVLFYATPIIYPLSIIPEKFIKLILLSPLAQIIQDARYLAITDQTVTTWRTLPTYLLPLPWLILGVAVVLSGLYFKAQAAKFAENV